VGYTLKENGHIQVMIIIQRLTPGRLSGLRIIWCLISIFYVVLLLIMTGQLAWESYELGAFSPTPSQLPMFPFQLVMPVGCLLLLLQLFVELFQAISSLLFPQPAHSSPEE
jgi:TRAP-type mannitol/chloroaromatic compound transport system permease small subunit